MTYMQKRTKLLLLIILGLLLLVLGVLLFISPILEERRRSSPQPPSLPERVMPSTSAEPSSVVPSTGVLAITVPTPEENQTRILENRARGVVERLGSGSSETGFLGYADVSSDMTSAGAAALAIERSALQQQHPATGPRFGLATRSVSARIVEGKSGEPRLMVSVEAIQQQDGGDPSRPSKAVAKRANVTFIKQPNGGYLIDRVVWENVEL